MNYHSRMMNIPASGFPPLDLQKAYEYYPETLKATEVGLAYKFGHRDARHAAAEIANEADARIRELEAVINRVAAQVGHPPIAPGEGALESIAEAVERHVAHAREREETLDSITPENLQAFAASEAHHDEHHARERELEAENKQMRRFLDEATANNVRLHEKFSPLESENAALKEKVAAAADVSEAYQLELADAAERTREIEALKAEAGKLKPVVGAVVAYFDCEDVYQSDAWVALSNAVNEYRKAAALQDGTDTSAAKLRENCIAYPTKLPERPTCVWLSDGRKIGIQREGGAVWLRIENAATVIPATPDAADIDRKEGE